MPLLKLAVALRDRQDTIGGGARFLAVSIEIALLEVATPNIEVQLGASDV
jgi:hypothetical protein